MAKKKAKKRKTAGKKAAPKTNQSNPAQHSLFDENSLTAKQASAPANQSPAHTKQASAQKKNEEDLPDYIAKWLEERKEWYKRNTYCGPHPDLQNSYWKCSHPYFNKPYIQKIQNERLKYAVVQVEKDLDWVSMAYGSIREIEQRPDFHTIYGRATRLTQYGQMPKGPVDKRLAAAKANRRCMMPHSLYSNSSMPSLTYYPWKIEVSSMLLQDDVPMESLYETLLHEYIHTIPGCLNHGKEWSFNARNCSAALGVHITRTSDAQTKGVDDQMEENARYILECQSCKKKTYRFRLCHLVEHPEHYKCKCGGTLKLIKGQEYLPKPEPSAPSKPDAHGYWIEASKPGNPYTGTAGTGFSSSSPAAQKPDQQQDSASARIMQAYPYVLKCTSCNKLFGRQRMSKTIQHPDHYRCPCGGKLVRVK